MRKTVFVLIAVLLCACMAMSVYATEYSSNASFRESFKSEDTTKVAGVSGLENIVSAEDEEMLSECIVVTSIEAAQDKTTDILQTERDLLLDVYRRLDSNEDELPLDYDYAIRNLLDVSFKNEACRALEEHNHKDQALKEEGVTITITFELGLNEDQKVDVLTYIDGEWTPIKKAVNNGDGSLTCTFEDLCPVAFAVAAN